MEEKNHRAQHASTHSLAANGSHDHTAEVLPNCIGLHITKVTAEN